MLAEQRLRLVQRIAVRAVVGSGCQSGDNRPEPEHFALKLIDPHFQLLKAFQRRCHDFDPDVSKEAGDDPRPIR